MFLYKYVYLYPLQLQALLNDVLNILSLFTIYIPVAPSVSSLSASSSTQLIITLTAPARSSSLTYKCTISTTVNGLSPKTKTGTVLQYTVNGLSPYVTYTVECTSSNGEDSCDSNMNTIRMPSAGE